MSRTAPRIVSMSHGYTQANRCETDPIFGDQISWEPIRKVVTADGIEGWVAARTIGLLDYRDTNGISESRYSLGSPSWDDLDSAPAGSRLVLHYQGDDKRGGKHYVKQGYDGKWHSGSSATTSKALAAACSRSKRQFAYMLIAC